MNLVLESFTGGWFTPLAFLAGFLSALVLRIRWLGRASFALSVIAFAVIVLGLVARQYVIPELWSACREPGARLAIETQIWATLISAAVIGYGVGFGCGVISRRRLVAGVGLASVVVVAVTVAAYVVVIGSGMSASSCLI